MKKEQTFENYAIQQELTEFNYCIFKNTSFLKSNLRSFEFIDCTFISCDFSMANFDNIVLTRVKFIDCKMLGVDFSKCSKYSLSVTFDKCILNYCHFLKNNLKKTQFNECIIKEANFFETDLKEASFKQCDLTDSIFKQCNLEQCDFRSSRNYSFVPSENKIKKAKFSFPDVIGLLKHYNIIIEE